MTILTYMINILAKSYLCISLKTPSPLIFRLFSQFRFLGARAPLELPCLVSVTVCHKKVSKLQDITRILPSSVPVHNFCAS